MFVFCVIHFFINCIHTLSSPTLAPSLNVVPCWCIQTQCVWHIQGMLNLLSLHRLLSSAADLIYTQYIIYFIYIVLAICVLQVWQFWLSCGLVKTANSKCFRSPQAPQEQNLYVEKKKKYPSKHEHMVGSVLFPRYYFFIENDEAAGHWVCISFRNVA